MQATRFADPSNNVWVLAEHGSDVTSVILAIPTTQWSREHYAAYDLIAEAWAYQVRKKLFELNRVLPVNAYSSPDVVGVIVETGPTDRCWLIDTLQQLSSPSLSRFAVPDETRRAAVKRLYRSRSEISSLTSWSQASHNYSISLEERVDAIWKSDLSDSLSVIDQHKKILVAVGQSLEPPECVYPIATLSHRRAEDAIESPSKDAISFVHSRAAELAQVAIVTPGVFMNSTRKADLHVFWTLMREREGVFYRLTRSRGGLIYSIAAFNREYHEGGFGLCVVSCAPPQVMKVVRCAREAAGSIASGNVQSALMDSAIDFVAMARSLAMRNPLAVAKALLASELSMVPLEDYSSQIHSVTHNSVAATAQRTVHNPGWRIRVTVPGDPE